MNETRAPTNEEIRERVLEDYRNGEKPKSLSEKTGISINTIKSWIKRDKARKADANKDASKSKKGASKNKKRGAPFGNKNAKGNRGGGAPLRNHNAEKHGAFSKIYWDMLQEDELAMIDLMDDDEEWLLTVLLRSLTIRERYFMQRIKQYKEMEETNRGLGVSSISKTKDTNLRLDKDGKPVLDEGGKQIFDTVSERTVTHTATIMKSIITLEAELTKIQRTKTKAIESLSKIRLERERIDIDNAREQREADLHDLQKELLDARIEHIDASTNKLLGTDTELEDTSDTDAMIYGDDTRGDAGEE